MKITWVLAVASALCLSVPALANDDCARVVKKAVEKSFPGSTVKKCEIEKKDGKAMYEVKLKTKEGYTTRMDLDPAGLVLLTQQSVPGEGVPTVVIKSFKTKYPDYKVMRTEKWTYPDGRVSYRVIYDVDGTKKSVVYTSEGAYVEEVEAVPDEDLD